MKPIVTAFITVFNEERWIESAIISLLNQSLSDIEILVVDDGSTDRAAEIINSIDDERLRLIQRDRNGRADSLAFACRQAKGKYLANLDADDEAYPERLAKQVQFLEAHPDYAWVGGGEEREDTQRNEHLKRLYPPTDSKIRLQCAKCIPYCHSAVMFRRQLIEQGINYDPKQPFLIDFEFFLRVAKQYKVANLPEIVVKRRARDDSYFQHHFGTHKTNQRLARLCAKAVYDFQLPRWYYIYPLLRLAYPLIPTAWKRIIRSRHGLTETHS